MSNYEKAQKLRKHFDEAFPSGMSERQVWFLVKYAKTVRKFARSNAAFNNLSNMLFEGIAKFKEVDKVDKLGRAYKGLAIGILTKNGEEVVMASESDYEDEGGEITCILY